jgi:hypothetical protein
MRVVQSDEGGRFLESVVEYRIMEEDPEGPFVAHHGAWLNLAEIEALARLPGTFTNEARSAISLLLSHA